MCLTVDKKLTKLRKKDTQQEYTFYKVLDIERHHGQKSKVLFKTPWQDMRIYSHGTITPTIPLVESLSGERINGGVLHLHVNREHAKEDIGYNSVILKVNVKKEHIVAYGNDTDVAVTQYNISKKEWDNAIRRAKYHLKNNY